MAGATGARCGTASGFELTVTEEAIRADFDAMAVGASRSVVVPFIDIKVGKDMYQTLEQFLRLYSAERTANSYNSNVSISGQAPGSVSLTIRRNA